MDILTQTESETFLGLQSGDGGTFLRVLISDVSVMLAQATGRSDWGPSSARTEYYDGGSSLLLLKYWPVTSIALYDDPDHAWATDTLVSSSDYYTDEDGVVWLEGGKFSDAPRSVKVVYTAGYANAAAIPDKVKAYAKRQLEHSYNSRQRPGRQVLEEFEGLRRSEILPDVLRGMAEFTRRVPFAT